MPIQTAIAKEVGIFITRWRILNRISHLEAAIRLGTDEKTLMKWEKDGSIPGADLLLLLDIYRIGPEVITASFRHILTKSASENNG